MCAHPNFDTTLNYTYNCCVKILKKYVTLETIKLYGSLSGFIVTIFSSLESIQMGPRRSLKFCLSLNSLGYILADITLQGHSL